MATNPNMVAIQTVTVPSGGAASIEFTSIPATFTDLILVWSVRAGADWGMTFQFNNSTSNRSMRLLYGTGAAAGSVTNTNFLIYGGQNNSSATANTFNNAAMYVPNYAGSNNKSFSVDAVGENNATTAYSGIHAGLWSDTSAITSIKLVAEAANFDQHSSATLYGVTSAAVGAKATGGIISEDNDYWYHTFTASGTFTPTQNLTADYLVVAGGGGGGGGRNLTGTRSGGGGGAGGLRCTVTATGGGGSLESALSLTAQAYTVTVGAGGAGGGVTVSGTNGSNSVFSTITSTGGGGGGAAGGAGGLTGGSGGGGGTDSNGASGTANQGYAGGNGPAGSNAGGGGGGASANGANGVDSGPGGNGGNGVATSISGSSVTYAGGGGGGDNTIAGTGGTGGGGNGNTQNQNGFPGTANTGGGGGGAGERDTADTSGGTGGSGIVIVRYAK